MAIANKTRRQNLERVQRLRQIRAGLVMGGITLTDVARSLKLSQSMVWQVAAGTKRSRRVEEALLKAAGVGPRHEKASE